MTRHRFHTDHHRMHKSVQTKSEDKHEHLFVVQLVLHWHLTISIIAFDAGDIVVVFGLIKTLLFL